MQTRENLNDSLPVDAVLGALKAALESEGIAVLEAPPGAGKTTRVPVALMDANWRRGGRIVMLEPRRLAARGAAHRMAAMLGESAGGRIGYRMRGDSRVSAATIVEVVTEGILTRMLAADPTLDGVAAVIFDEFHERSLQADAGLALTLEVRRQLREDLRLVVMSATLDGDAIARHLGGAPRIRAEGRMFPVETRYVPPRPGERPAQAVARAVGAALADDEGSILAFLPGEAEIRQAAALIESEVPDGVIVAPLYGRLDQKDQDAAIRPAPPGARKVVLATAIAETSLTIEGIRIVVDSGWSRLARYDPASGLSSLETVRVSQAASEQRRGRAGRLAPGLCIRLWAEEQQRGLVPFHPPEIMAADLAPLLLDIAAFGAAPADLPWLDPPPQAALAEAQTLLRALGALDAGGSITPHGQAMARFAAHPRLAHMMIEGTARGQGAEAAILAAILSERDLLHGPQAREADLTLRLDAFSSGGPNADRGARARAREQAAQWQRMLQTGQTGAAALAARAAGALLALAYPDRIAQARPGARGRFLLAGGRGATLAETDPLAGETFLAVAVCDGSDENARIRLAAPLDPADAERAAPNLVRDVEAIAFDARTGAVSARKQKRLGALVLEDRPIEKPDPGAVRAALIGGLRQAGFDALSTNDGVRHLRARVAFLRRLDPGDWPDWSDDGLMETLDIWLAPHLDGITRLSALARLDLLAILLGGLAWEQRRRLDSEAPPTIEVPSGSRIGIDYTGPEPVLPVRLQELFGLAETPRIARGRVPLVLHLLSPARRPVQVTRDLASFWARGYPDVKKDLKGRYPKHFWPDDPLAAPPTARTRPRP